MRKSLPGIILLTSLSLMILSDWHGAPVFARGAGLCVLLFLVLATGYVAWSRRIFVIVGLILVLLAVLTRSDWQPIVAAALKSAAFIAAFFTALTCLRNASSTSPSLERCGRFLAEQRPGRRYAALTVGGHLFGLVLNYGAISLLGTLAEANARREPNKEIRDHRIRRMLLAIQRGFVSTLCWSPMTFSIAISTSIVPGASWADAAPLCLVSSVIMAGLGWALDTIFKPRLTIPSPLRPKPAGSWATLLPMVALLTMLVFAVGVVHVLTGIRAVGVVMVVVPLMSLGWIAKQTMHRNPVQNMAKRTLDYTSELFGYRSELVLLVMAGFIGTLGSQLLTPHMTAFGLDLAVLPGSIVLVALVWLIPLAGLIGMNPILAVSLIAPLLPDAEAMNVTPTAIIVALTAGWALSGASSPFTATTLLIGSIAKVSSARVGMKWNGAYTAICCLALSMWIAAMAFI